MSENDSIQIANDSGTHKMPGLAPKRGSMSRLSLSKLLEPSTHRVLSVCVWVSVYDDDSSSNCER
jgi:hypothetical protein